MRTMGSRKMDSLPPSVAGSPDFEEWRRANRPSFDSWDFIFPLCEPEVFIAIGECLWPRFACVDEIVFFEGTPPENVEQWKLAFASLEDSGERKRNIELKLSYRCIADLFAKVPEDALVREKIARTIAFFWGRALETAFPDRDFVVEASEMASEGDGDWYVAFCGK